MVRVLVGGDRTDASTFGRHLGEDYEVLVAFSIEEVQEVAPSVDVVVVIDEFGGELTDVATPVVHVTYYEPAAVADVGVDRPVTPEELVAAVERAHQAT